MNTTKTQASYAYVSELYRTANSLFQVIVDGWPIATYQLKSEAQAFASGYNTRITIEEGEQK